MSLPIRLLALLSLCACLPMAMQAQDFMKQFPLRKETKFFDFRYKGNEKEVEKIARFADAYVRVIHREFFTADFDYPIKVLVLEDRATFQNFLRKEFHISDPPNFGIYLEPPYKLFATFVESGLGTFTHEILHPLTLQNLPDMPIWAIEGIPTFFEKFVGYWKEDKLVMEFGYQNPWRIEVLGDELPKLDLRALVATKDSIGKFRESDLRMLSMFLWKQGKFRQLLELIEKKDRKGMPSYFEAAMEMPMAQIVPLWQQYLQEVHAHRKESMQLPLSTVLDDEVEYRLFKAKYGLKPER